MRSELTLTPRKVFIMPQKLKYLGVPVFMNGQNYYVPSLSTIDFRSNYGLLTSAPPEGSSPTESFERLIPVIGLAVRRNYPDVTDDNLEEWLDLTTFPTIIRAVQGASGLEPVSEGE
jgi:hypothetical protein